MSLTHKKYPITEFTISNRTVLRVLLLIVLAMIGIAAVRKAGHALLLIFTAAFLALALNAPVHWIAQRIPGKRKGSRTIATAISCLAVLLVLGGFLASIVPPLVRQTNNFISTAPQLIAQAKDSHSGVGKFVQRYNLQSQVQDFSDQLGQRLKGATGTAVSAVGKVGSSIFATLTVLVLTIMMLTEGPRWLRFFKEVIPDEHQERAHILATDMYKVVKGYVNGQVVLAAIAAVAILPALFILRIDYPIALMVVVFFCGLIPLVGHTLGAIIVTTVALFTSPIAAAIILAYYFLYQQTENYFVQPRIQANSTNMSPLLVFASVIVGVSFSGLLGGLVAIPVAGCIRIVILDYLRRRKIISQRMYKEVTTDKPL
jgi:predicted PurR-regulated permease PerM